MSEICIIGNSNIKHISLISLYTDYFDLHNIKYDLVYMDRYNINEKNNAENVYRFYVGDLRDKKIKVKKFFEFRKFCLNVLRNNNYKIIITWQATTAYILADYLLMHRRTSKYIINFRDYIMENNRLIRFILKRLVKQSTINTISSPAFLEFLPKGEYLFVNSFDEKNEKRAIGQNEQFGSVIKIGFVGNCRFFDESYKLINALRCDSMYELWYCGTNSDVIENYAEAHEIKNVKTTGPFQPDETVEIMMRFDFINCAFGNEKLNVKTLIPIRLYTALSLHLPVIVNEGTALAEIVKKYNVGVVVKDYNQIKDAINAFVQSFEREVFNENCDCFIRIAKEQNQRFYSCLENAIKEAGIL